MKNIVIPIVAVVVFIIIIPLAAEATIEEEETELDEEAAQEKAKLQEQEDYLIFRLLNKFEVKEIVNIPKTEALSETHAINIYKEIQDNCNQCGFPITPIENSLK